MKNKNIVIGVLLLVLAGIVIYFFMSNKKETKTTTTSTTSGLSGLDLGGLLGGLFSGGGPKPKVTETEPKDDWSDWGARSAANQAANFNGN